MIKVFILFVVTMLVTALWFIFGGSNFNRDTYVTKKVLEYSIPFSVKIDTELLDNLKTANE